MIRRKDQGVALAPEGGNGDCKSIGGAHGGRFKSKRIVNDGLSLLIVSNVGRKSDSLCWSNSFPVPILSASQTKHPSGGVTKALLAGRTTQIQNVRPNSQTNVVDINEAQVTTVLPTERFTGRQRFQPAPAQQLYRISYCWGRSHDSQKLQSSSTLQGCAPSA